MSNRRNIGIMGHPDSGVSEVFGAIQRLDQTPKPEQSIGWSGDGLTDWTEQVPPPYDAKKRRRFHVRKQ